MPAQSPIVECPDCNVPMGVKRVSTRAAGEMTKVIYACVICRTEAVRHYTMPAPPPSPSPGEENRAP